MNVLSTTPCRHLDLQNTGRAALACCFLVGQRSAGAAQRRTCKGPQDSSSLRSAALCPQDVLRCIFDRDSEQLEFLQVPGCSTLAQSGTSLAPGQPWRVLPTPTLPPACAPACPLGSPTP